MERFSKDGVVVARILISIVFVLNAFGIIDQAIPAREMVEHGAPVTLVPWLMFAGRALELIAGVSLSLGVYPRFAALALLGFLIPATFVSHSFWLAYGTSAFQPQLINFSKNVAIWGGLLFISATSSRTALTRLRSADLMKEATTRS
jgi:putative oxidoreductase